jgi:Sulfotransferase domain
MAKRSLARGVYGGVRLLQRASSPARMLPTFLVVGAKRAGTSSLYRYLTSHPEVRPCKSGKGTHYFDVAYGRGWRWYRSSFPLATRGGITGEASPYYMFHPLAASRIADALPDARLIVVLRDPVERAWSHYHNERRLQVEPLSFEDAIGSEPERLAGQAERMAADPGYHSFAWRHYSYLARGRYAEQLERLYELFPPSHVLVVQSELLLADPNRALQDVWPFLGVAPFTVQDRFNIKPNHSFERMAAATRERLQAYFAESNRRLYRLPGVGFRWSDASPSAPDLHPAKE